MLEPEELARKLLADNHLCVLATASTGGKPEAALIEYAEDGLALYFETFPEYRKYANLKENPRVSIVLAQLPYTLQMDGVAEELNGDGAAEAKARLKAKTGGHGFYADPKVRFFKFAPNWARLLSTTDKPTFIVLKE